MRIFSGQDGHFALSHKPRLVSAIVLGTIVGIFLPANLPIPSRAVLAWDVLAITYLVLTLSFLFVKNTVDALKALAAKEDQNRWIILAVMTIAAFASLIAIGTLLTNLKNLAPMTMHLHVIFGAITVLASWSMMHMIFAVHYAHEYYGDSDDSPDNYDAYKGLIFPGGKEPVFSDFMYFSFVVGMTCQVSDVQVCSQLMRRITLLHGVLAFFFNTVILALTVNVAAGLLS